MVHYDLKRGKKYNFSPKILSFFSSKMCFCTFENVKKVDFVLLKMDFFWNFNSLCAAAVALLFCDDAVPTTAVVEWLLDDEEIFEFEFPAIIFEEVVLLVIDVV